MEGFPDSIKQLFRSLFPRSSEQGSSKVTITDLRSLSRSQQLKAAGIILSVAMLIIFTGFLIDARSKFLPHTSIETVPVGSLTPDEALIQLRNAGLTPPEHTVRLSLGDTAVASSSAELNAHYQYDTVLDEAKNRQQADWFSWLRRLLFETESQPALVLPVYYDPEKLRFLTAVFKQQFDTPPFPPKVTLGTSGAAASITVDPGKDASAVDAEATFQRITEILSNTAGRTEENTDKTIVIEPVTQPLSRQLSAEETEQARQRAANLVGEKLIFEKDHITETLNDKQLISLLVLPEGYTAEPLAETLQDWAQEINRSPQNAEFSYNPDTLEVSVFAPHRNGLELDLAALREKILEGVRELEGTDTKNLADAAIIKELALIETEPETTLAETNDLGIAERIGFGESYYYHSIPNRIHNVSLTSQRITLTLVAPGKEFSFNAALGDVSAATGYRPAYVIKDGQTALGDGGGVCQVSSTLFRALLDSGLEITRRLQHSYRVSYYELDSKPGFDATVYAGNVDLRFINDTEHYVLIYSQANPSTLYMTVELYGTSDGRTTEVKDYQSWDPQPALPTEYIPDPTLAPGQLEQVDWAAAGIKARFTHVVRDRDGKVMRENTYYSHYRPWAAKFRQGV